MADCDDLFKDFYSEIDLSSSKKDNLKKSRDAVREKIENYFKNCLKSKIPSFHMQGSFVIRTVINPIDGEYDLDDGVYLQNLPENFEDWPCAETVHNWIKKSVEGHTSLNPIDKENCVRLVYKNYYHIDLPVYGIHEGEIRLARKGAKEWQKSDPKSFTNWFHTQLKRFSGQDSEQMRRNVQYLKAWKDYKSIKFPSIALTILAGNYHMNYPGRDDESLFYVLKEMFKHIENDRRVIKPVYPYDDVIENLSDTQIGNFFSKLNKLQVDANKAICLSEGEKNEASSLWEKHFGERFPIIQSEKEETRNYNQNIIIPISTKPKPWGSDEMV
jgi:hypothetical protein